MFQVCICALLFVRMMLQLFLQGKLQLRVGTSEFKLWCMWVSSRWVVLQRGLKEKKGKLFVFILPVPSPFGTGSLKKLSGEEDLKPLACDFTGAHWWGMHNIWRLRLQAPAGSCSPLCYQGGLAEMGHAIALQSCMIKCQCVPIQEAVPLLWL